MPRYLEIKTKILNNYSMLPKNQKILGNYFIDNFDKIPFLNVQQVSEATSLSVASVIRFTQRIGFTGFLEFRDAISRELQKRIHNKEIFALVDESKIKNDILASIASKDIKNINESLFSIDRESFDLTINLILRAKRVYTAGLGISSLLSNILSYQLNQVAIKSQNFVHDHSTFAEQILFLSSNDLLIAFSFPPYSKETVIAAEFARKKNIKVVAITNKEASPITRFSETSLVVKSQNLLFTNSFTAISVLINAIATQCAIRNKHKAEKMLKEFNELPNNNDLIVE
jgi:DNA-binding MurR/RpiR family transcriptional regulator